MQAETLQRRFAGEPVGEHHATGRLGDEIRRPKARVRPGQTEGRHADDDESGVHRARCGAVEAERRRLVRRRVVEPEVGVGDELAQPLAVRSSLAIHDEASLAGVVELEEQAPPRVGGEERRQPARLGAARRLDLPHLGAEIREQPAGEFRGDARGLDDACAAQYRLRHG